MPGCADDGSIVDDCVQRLGGPAGGSELTSIHFSKSIALMESGAREYALNQTSRRLT
jgi:hypothetical protein